MTLHARKLSLILLAVTGILLLCIALWLQNFISTAVTPAAPQIVEIKSGSSFSRVASQLEQSGIIKDARLFTLLARWHKATGQIHAGEYLFETSAKPDDILARLIAGDIRKFQVTIPEGFNLQEIAARLEKTGIGSSDEFLALCSDARFLNELDIDAASLEGYLFPETYTYSSSTTPSQILTAMVAQLRMQLTPELLKSAAALNLNRHQLLTLASIIQKEAGNVMEMPLISAVFHNRLKRGIALQADPTVIYGITDFDGNLTRKHLETPTPYNTYRTRGLPPGPIASPGHFALQAAANPAVSKDLYFVSRGDGTHVFSTNLNDHNRAVRRYQLGR
ncbi:MAG: endolytic transglycosylase MltG [Desulfuromonadales bacterium]